MSSRNIHQILTNINSLLEANLNYSNNEYHGLAVLQPKGGMSFPMIRTTTQEGRKISPLDTKAMQFYHRIVESTTDSIPGKGMDNYQIITYKMILVGVGFRRNVTTDNVWDNEDRAREVMNILATNPSLSNKEMLMVEGQTDTDKLTVLNNEYDGNERLKERTLDLLAFSISYTLRMRSICDTFISPPMNFTLSAAIADGFTGTVDLPSVGTSLEWGYSLDNSVWLVAGTTAIGTPTFNYTGLSSTTLYYGRARIRSSTNSGYSGVDSITTASSVDPDAQAWVDLMDSPTQSQIDAINAYVIAEKAAGNQSLKRYEVLPSLGEGNGLIDVGGKSEPTPAGGITWDATGIIFNGTNSEVPTGYVINTDNPGDADNMIASCYIEDYNNSTGTVQTAMGAAASGFRLRCPRINNSNERPTFSLGTNAGNERVISINNGMYSVRTVSELRTDYYNGASLGSAANATWDNTPADVYLGSRDGLFFFDGKQRQAMIAQATGFDLAAHYTNLTALLTALTP